MDVSTQAKIAHFLRVWHALSVEVHTRLRHSRGSVMLLTRDICGSNRRTKKGVLVDYTIWLAGYGLGPTEDSIQRLADVLSETERNRLVKGREYAQKLAEARRAGAKAK